MKQIGEYALLCAVVAILSFYVTKNAVKSLLFSFVLTPVFTVCYLILYLSSKNKNRKFLT